MSASSLNLDDSAVALQGYSPVSYVEDGRAEIGRPEHKVTHAGVVYYLANELQVERFTADPEKFIPMFGGWCAFGMSVDQRFRIDPESFKIVDGKLLVFLNDIETDARSLWNDGDHAELMNKANSAWEQFRAAA